MTDWCTSSVRLILSMSQTGRLDTLRAALRDVVRGGGYHERDGMLCSHGYHALQETHLLGPSFLVL